MLNKSGESGHPCHVRSLRKRFVFHCWEWCLLWFCHIWPLLCWVRFPLCPLSGEFLSKISVEFCQTVFLHLLRWSYGFLFFSWLMQCITLIDMCILKNPCIPGINHTWSWCMSLLMCCWILFASILLRIFVSIFISDIGLQFPFLWYLCLVLISGWWWPHRMSLGVLLTLQYFRRVWEGQVLDLL